MELAGYQLFDEIGAGAFGNVRIAINKKTLLTYAVKIFDMSKADVQTVKREIVTHKNIKHHNIIELKDLIQENKEKIWYLILEYAPNGELFDIIEPDVGIEEDYAHIYFRQLIQGLTFLHSRGIAHRDIKPENLLLDCNNNLKIADFGLATYFRYKGKERKLESRCGTHSYIAPEVYAGKEQYSGPPADLWSCGVVLVALLAGRLPWDFPSLECPEFLSWSEQKLGYEPWIRMGTETKKFLLKILNINPQNRLSISRMQKSTWFQRRNKLAKCSEDGSVRFADNSQPSLESLDPYIQKRMHLSVNGSSQSQCFTREKENLHSFDNDTDMLSQPICNMNSTLNKGEGLSYFSQPTQTDDMFLSQRDVISPFDHCSQMSQSSKIPYLVSRMTRFLTAEDPGKVWSFVKSVLSAEPYKINISEENLTVKAQTICKRKSVVVFTIQLHQMNSSLHLVDFRRHKGDGLEFKKIFQIIKEEMQHLIY